MSSPPWEPTAPDKQRFQNMAKPWEPRPVREPVGPLSRASEAFFETRYEIPLVTAQRAIAEAPQSGRYVLSIRGPNGALRGHQLRKPWAGAPLIEAFVDGYKPGMPKADTFMTLREPVQSHYSGFNRAGALVLVEDQLSAIKLSVAGYDAVALMGTPDNPDMVRIAELSARAALHEGETVIALDNDATAKAFAFARQYGSAFRALRVAILFADIKDTKLDDIPGVLGLE